jgi:hypothetical protein
VSVIGIARWGPLIIGTDVDDAMISSLKTWMPTYLKHFHDERGLPFVPARPRTYANTFADQEFLDHQLPAIIVVTATTIATRGGPNKAYEGTWRCDIATIVRGKRPPATRFLASLYEGVVRQAVLNQARTTDVLQDVHYTGMRYEQVSDASGSGRYLLAGVSSFNVYTDKIVEANAGPDIPDADEYLNEATITEVDIEVDAVNIGGTFT